MRLGIAGLGTVGGALIQQLEARARNRKGKTIEIAAVSARTKRDLAYDFTANALELIKRDDIDVIVELIGGADGIAYDLVKGALEAGKHVVTANKALLAKHGLELAKMAEDKGLALNYEAAIASGVPIVKILRESMNGDNIYEIKGILNGTSNYILCQMSDLDMKFNEALNEAKALGYAEADPTFDINGRDAAHKLQLLISLAFATQLKNLPTQGIDKIEPLDMQMAKDLSYAIRLLGQAKKTEQGISASVEPVLVALGTKLSQSSGTDNMIGILSDKRHLFLEGEGAGAGPTAASVLADIIDIASSAVLPVFGMPVQHLTHQQSIEEELPSAFYIRSFVEDRAGAIAAMTNVMAQLSISLSGINQPAPPPASGGKAGAKSAAAVIFITHPIDRAKIDKAVKALNALPQVIALPLAIRIET